MEIIYLKDTKDILTDIKDLGLVLGYFDGVHIGHAQLINFAKQNTKRGSLGVLTFDRALKSVEGSLMSISDKAEAMEKLGVDYLFIIVCDDELKRMSYKTFVEQVLKKFNPKELFCGPDFKFGYQAEGDVNYLKECFPSTYVLGYVKDHFGEKISSSSIKNSILKGEIQEANRHLGRPYRVNGAVIRGFSEGAKLGFPTANLLPDINYVFPPNGVYFTKTIINGVVYNSITNVGTHPTINEVAIPIVETYVLNNNFDNLYGEHIQTCFYKRLRPEIKFNNVDELKRQIEKDVLECKRYFEYEVKN